MSTLFNIISAIGAWATLFIVFGCAVGLGAWLGVERPELPLEGSSLWWIE